MSKARVETLVDGVFAIAMTLLILEVKVPELANPRSARELLGALGHAVPTAIAYFASFFMLGAFWVWHHGLAEKVRAFDLPLLVLTFFFLSLVSSFPFAAALWGHYLGNVATMVVYGPVLGMILFCQVLFLVIARRRGLVRDDVDPTEIRQAHRGNLMGLAIFLMGISPAALYFGWTPFALVLALAATAWIVRFRAGRA
jgi:uncharacterized membrane protein